MKTLFLLLVVLMGVALAQPNLTPDNRSHFLRLYFTSEEKLNHNFTLLDSAIGPLAVSNDPDHPENNFINIWHYDALNRRLGMWDATAPTYTLEMAQAPGNSLLAIALRNLATVATSNTAFIAQGPGSLSFRTQNLDGSGGWWQGQMAGLNQPWRIGPGNVYPDDTHFAIQIDQPSLRVTIPRLVLGDPPCVGCPPPPVTSFRGQGSITVAAGAASTQADRCTLLPDITVTGALAGDFVQVATDPNSHIINNHPASSTGMLYQGWVAATHVVRVIACCYPGTSGFATGTPITCPGPTGIVKVLVERTT
jgi:hypothetical protein